MQKYDEYINEYGNKAIFTVVEHFKTSYLENNHQIYEE